MCVSDGTYVHFVHGETAILLAKLTLRKEYEDFSTGWSTPDGGVFQ